MLLLAKKLHTFPFYFVLPPHISAWRCSIFNKTPIQFPYFVIPSANCLHAPLAKSTHVTRCTPRTQTLACTHSFKYSSTPSIDMNHTQAETVTKAEIPPTHTHTCMHTYTSHTVIHMPLFSCHIIEYNIFLVISCHMSVPIAL